MPALPNLECENCGGHNMIDDSRMAGRQAVCKDCRHAQSY
jgi:formylmethanofuran dehydrogenase subunit E